MRPVLYRFRLLLILLLIVYAGGLPVHAENKSRSYEKDSMHVNITQRADEIKGFKSFMIEAKNLGFIDRSVEVRIYLNNRNRKEPAGYQGRCTVFLRVSVGGTASQKKDCKEKEPGSSNSWSAEIVKVYEFMPPEEESGSDEPAAPNDSEVVDEDFSDVNGGTEEDLPDVDADSDDELDQMEDDLDEMEKELDAMESELQ